jgi:uncharacterized protein (TIGR02271 family)
MLVRKAVGPNTKKSGARIISRTADATIPIIEEEAFFDKRVVEKGKVSVNKQVVEHVEVVDEPLFYENVRVERVSVNQFVETAPEVRIEGDVTIIPVLEERLVVQKQLVVVEEIRIQKELVETHRPHKVNLRKEQVDVRRVAREKGRAVKPKQ